MGFALGKASPCGLDEQIDVIPVDYCAEALIGLALKCLGTASTISPPAIARPAPR